MSKGWNKSHRENDEDLVQMGGTPHRKEMVGIGVLATVRTAHSLPSATESFSSPSICSLPPARHDDLCFLSTHD